MKIEEFPTGPWPLAPGVPDPYQERETYVFSDYDWGAVLQGKACNDVRCEDASTIPAEPTRMFTPDEVEAVDCWYAESPEGYGSTSAWGILRLKDGTWAACIAWCDTTGWDCRSDTLWRLLPTREEAVALGLDEEGRRHLGLELAEGPS